MRISNERISLKVSETGAEPVSLLKDGKEYLWQADPAFWKRSAPILFPIVGTVFGGVYRLAGKNYNLGQHGFARDCRFDVLECAGGKMSLLLRDSDETLRLFPFHFELQADYFLQESEVRVVWTVRNTGSPLEDGSMYFQIGAHPGFNYPDFNASDDVHSYLEFYDSQGKRIAPVIYSGLRDGGLDDMPARRMCDDSGRLPLYGNLFNSDALVFEKGQVARTLMLDKNGKPYLSVSSDCAQVLGIWSPVRRNAPFVCIEPWMGEADRKGFTGDFQQKAYIQHLAPDSQMTFEYSIFVY